MNREHPPVILVIDDNSRNIQLIATIVSEEGYRVSLAADGERALGSMEREEPDLILCDIIMPVMDGYEFCRRIKKNPQWKDIPLLFLTAQTDAETETKCLDLGAVDFVGKPINPSVLKARIRTHLRLREALEEERNQRAVVEENARLKELVEKITLHDLKGPLSGVLGVGELLEQTCDKIMHMADLLQESGLRMSGIINLTSDLYKMESGTYVVKDQHFDFFTICSRLQDSHRALGSSKHVQIETDFSGLAPDAEGRFLVPGEELLAQNMLSNLIKNAVEASPPQKRVRLHARCTDRLCITIENEGEVPESIREGFFDKFVTAGKENGTGLGTYSAKLIAKTLGGEIELDTSRPGMTAVTVRLPVDPPQDSTGRAEEPLPE